MDRFGGAILDLLVRAHGSPALSGIDLGRHFHMVEQLWRDGDTSRATQAIIDAHELSNCLNKSATEMSNFMKYGNSIAPHLNCLNILGKLADVLGLTLAIVN